MAGGFVGPAWRALQLQELLEDAGFYFFPDYERDAYRLFHRPTKASVTISTLELMREIEDTKSVPATIAGIIRLATRKLTEAQSIVTFKELPKELPNGE